MLATSTNAMKIGNVTSIKINALNVGNAQDVHQCNKCLQCSQHLPSQTLALLVNFHQCNIGQHQCDKRWHCLQCPSTPTTQWVLAMLAMSINVTQQTLASLATMPAILMMSISKTSIICDIVWRDEHCHQQTITWLMFVMLRGPSRWQTLWHSSTQCTSIKVNNIGAWALLLGSAQLLLHLVFCLISHCTNSRTFINATSINHLQLNS